MLDDYRRSFGEAYEPVVRTIRQRGEFPTGRLAKSTRSIVEKLRRESIRLTQMQDIAGCRVVVTDIIEQERVVASLGAAFPGASVIDRRDNPSYGYRAVHIIAMISGKPVEIQVRTVLQHLWAEFSEKSSDVLDPTIKYGGGPAEWRSVLTRTSQAVSRYEKLENRQVAALEVYMNTVVEEAERFADEQGKKQAQEELRLFREAEKAEIRELDNAGKDLADLLSEATSQLNKLKGQKQ